MITDPVALAHQFERMARAFELNAPQSPQSAAKIVTASVDRRIIAAVGADRILSGTTRTTGTSRKGKPIKATSKLLNGGPAAQVLVGVTGPLQLVEKDIKPHLVVSKYAKGAGYTNAKGRKGRATRKSRIASVAFGLGAAGGGRRAVLHFGDVFTRYTTASSPGKHVWRDGVADATPQLIEAHAAVQRQAIRSVFPG